MTNERKIVSIAGLAAVLLCAAAVPAVAELQECFRDGYLCSLKCVAPDADKSRVTQCDARCNDEEKVCIGKVAETRGRPGQPANTPAVSPIKVRFPAGASPASAR